MNRFPSFMSSIMSSLPERAAGNAGHAPRHAWSRGGGSACAGGRRRAARPSAYDAAPRGAASRSAVSGHPVVAATWIASAHVATTGAATSGGRAVGQLVGAQIIASVERRTSTARNACGEGQERGRASCVHGLHDSTRPCAEMVRAGRVRGWSRAGDRGSRCRSCSAFRRSVG